MIGVVDGWREHFRACGVSEADIEILADRIDGPELLGQRRGFDPALASKNRPRQRRGSFKI